MSLDRNASPIFGEKFPYPLDGKALVYAIAREFATEFNQLARIKLADLYSSDRALQQQELTVTGAYPTTRQQCPRIAVQRMGSTPKMAGLGGEIETREIQLEGGVIGFRHFKGQMVTDTIEVGICTINEELRDDLHIWVQQYFFDAIFWAIPQLPSVHVLQCTNAVDDLVEYRGAQDQPGFEFYISRLTFQCQYDLVVLTDANKLEAIVNWQQCLYANEET